MARKSAQSTGSTPAIKALEQRGIEFRLHSYDFDPGDLGIGEQAALALGIGAERLFKTLMVIIDAKRPAIALTPAAAETRMKTLASKLDGKRAAMAPLAEAERLSGYVKGGISPLGQRQKLDAVVDRSIKDHQTIFINGGRRGLQIELKPDDLIDILGASVADLAR